MQEGKVICLLIIGNSNGWQLFYINMAELGPLFNVQINDTILFRFSFISDSTQTNKDGLMFDDFVFEDWAEGIPEAEKNNLISIFPNPASDALQIFHVGFIGKQSVQILNYTGNIFYDDSNSMGQTIDIHKLPSGIYFLKYSDTKNFIVKKFVVQH